MDGAGDTGLNYDTGRNAAPELAWTMLDGPADDGALNQSAGSGFYAQLAELEGKLYNTWYEETNGVYQIRVAVHDTAWRFVDGNGDQGLNRTADTDGWCGRATSFGDYLYVAWSEGGAGSYHVRLSTLDPSSGVWSAAGPPTGFNRASASVAEYPRLTATSAALYATWTERIDGAFRVLVMRGTPANTAAGMTAQNLRQQLGAR